MSEGSRLMKTKIVGVWVAAVVAACSIAVVIVNILVE
jgi:hypothetical protein